MRHISPWLVQTLALGQYHLQARGYLIAVVDTIEDIRWANLLLLIQEYGSIQGVAELISKSHSHVSQYKLRSPHSRTGKPRNIGSPMARLLEAKAGKGHGWMDQPHAAAKALAQAELLRLHARSTQPAPPPTGSVPVVTYATGKPVTVSEMKRRLNKDAVPRAVKPRKAS